MTACHPLYPRTTYKPNLSFCVRQEQNDASGKPRRVAILLSDDDDDDVSSSHVDCDSNVDGEQRGGNLHSSTAPTTASPGRTLQQLTEERQNVDDESSDVDVGEDPTAAAAAAIEPSEAAAAAAAVAAAAAAACDGGWGIDDTPALHRPKYRVRCIQ